MIIACKLDVTKIDKSKIFVGAKGKYIDIVLLEKKGGCDNYGNDFLVVQSISKEERAAGKQGPILGNGKYIGQKPTQSPAPSSDSAAKPPDGEDDVPF